MFPRVVCMLFVVSAGLSATAAAQGPRFDILNTGWWLDIDVAQAAGVPRARGTLNAVSPIRSSYEAIEIGMLQVANNWATLTVRARVQRACRRR